ncbi:MAG: hypothetical protein JRH07_15560 [Deltaproteobacteria bacterium]|nr:hypothetical protein [Deltaproteobacteria bacterium]MBW2123242.1 hypothetical protein [Deltaproteobacteria bacterium]
MKIKIINPNTMEQMTREINETVKRVARPDTEFLTVNPPRGPLSIEGAYDSYLAAREVLGEVLKDRERYDAYVIACFGDVGLDGAREVVDVPVIGICEAALHVASMLAPRFSILTVIPRVIVLNRQLVNKYGFECHLASIRATDLPVEEFARDAAAAQKALLLVGWKISFSLESLCLRGSLNFGEVPLSRAHRGSVGAPIRTGRVPS